MFFKTVSSTWFYFLCSFSLSLSLTLTLTLTLPHWQFFRVIPIYIFIIFICLFSRTLAIPLLISACSRFLPLTLSLVSSCLFSFALSFALCLSLNTHTQALPPSFSLSHSLSLSLSLFRYSLRSSYKCTLVTIMYWTMFNNVMNAHAGHSVCSRNLRACISYFRVRCTYVYACTSITRVSTCIRHAFLVRDLLQFYDTTMTTIILFAPCLSRSCFLSPHSGSRGFVRSPSRLRDPTLSTRVQMFTFQREIAR